MSLSVASLGSGSRGNAFLVEADETRLLVDAGFSGAQLARRLEALDVAPESIDLVVVTHEHRDHTSGIGVGARRWGWELAMNPATRRACDGLLRGGESIAGLPADGLRVGPLDIEPVSTCHDAADPVAIVVRHRRSGLRVGIATDLGRATVPVRQALRGCAFLVLESNHDERLLRDGPYPWGVKQRIGGSRGHLSNRLAAQLARELVHPGLGGILLAHLSAECNDPDLAADRVAEGLMPTRWGGVLASALQDYPSERFDVERLAAAQRDGPQLSLFGEATG
ncbi:MAG: MBL fold metallo-hydrolase [Gemmatimonadota bacterium]|nr:MBL fold metallo-hydrolase [Gemmatimonadota bacterium]